MNNRGNGLKKRTGDVRAGVVGVGIMKGRRKGKATPTRAKPTFIIWSPRQQTNRAAEPCNYGRVFAVTVGILSSEQLEGLGTWWLHESDCIPNFDLIPYNSLSA